MSADETSPPRRSAPGWLEPEPRPATSAWSVPSSSPDEDIREFIRQSSRATPPAASCTHTALSPERWAQQVSEWDCTDWRAIAIGLEWDPCIPTLCRIALDSGSLGSPAKVSPVRATPFGPRSTAFASPMLPQLHEALPQLARPPLVVSVHSPRGARFKAMRSDDALARQLQQWLALPPPWAACLSPTP